MFDHLSRREFSLALASAAGVAPWFLARPVSGKDVTRTSEAIRQEITLNANPARVYTALTDAAQFTKLVAFSSVKNAPPAQIDPNVGGTFSLSPATSSAATSSSFPPSGSSRRGASWTGPTSSTPSRGSKSLNDRENRSSSSTTPAFRTGSASISPRVGGRTTGSLCENICCRPERDRPS